MNIPSAATLRKAIEITTQIERLQARLQALLSEEAVSPKKALRKSAPKKKSVSVAEVSKEEEIMAPPLASVCCAPAERHPEELFLMDDDGSEQLALVGDRNISLEIPSPNA